jgi:hypothetical protein
MAKPHSSQTRPPALARLKRLAMKVVIQVTLGLLLGFGYGWAAPRLYGPERSAGFRLGILHGGLMPVALPSLLLGKDVPIYADRNQGRTYKLGYIVGINACGLLFFGSAFWRPARATSKAAESSPRDQ